jgi:hypothetical protein
MFLRAKKIRIWPFLPYIRSFNIEGSHCEDEEDFAYSAKDRVTA